MTLARIGRSAFVVVLVACGGPPEPAQPRPGPTREAPPVAPPGTPPPATPKSTSPAEKLSVDTPKTTVKGAGFIAPAGWTIRVKNAATILEAPEADSFIALVDVEADTADAAVAAAWAAYRSDGRAEAKWPLRTSVAKADKDGWKDQRVFDYVTSPNEKREVQAGAMRPRSGGPWTVWIADMSDATGEKRLAQTATIFGRLFPKGYERESFKGKKANTLDEKRVRELSAFVERAQKLLGVPGVSVGIIQDKKTVLAAGFGVRELGKPAKVGPDTLYIIASNTKAMTTLMLAKLVDEKKLTWDTQVKSVLPQFKLGDAATTEKVLVKHLVCACTGLPRQDLEWFFEFKNSTPASVLATLGTMQPTSKFGEIFQYSNTLAAAAGFVGGYVVAPKQELGAGYDEAMRSRVFGPLRMNATTFDFKKALAGDHASPHSPNVDDKTAVAAMDVNYSIIADRPAGGAWSSVNDVLKYIAMELGNGVLADGSRYIAESALLARRETQVTIGKDETYGMGLSVDTMYGTPIVHHGGSLIGYKSDMMWLPEHGVGAVVLTNGDTGGMLHSRFRRKLLEVLFDGNAEADGDVEARAKARHERVMAARKLLTIPPAKEEGAKLAAKYKSPALGELRVSRAGDTITFDFGEWKSAMASRKEPDGTTSFITISPGVDDFAFVPGTANGKPTLVLRDAQHEYAFTAE